MKKIMTKKSIACALLSVGVGFCGFQVDSLYAAGGAEKPASKTSDSTAKEPPSKKSFQIPTEMQELMRAEGKTHASLIVLEALKDLWLKKLESAYKELRKVNRLYSKNPKMMQGMPHEMIKNNEEAEKVLKSMLEATQKFIAEMDTLEAKSKKAIKAAKKA
jgi:hypothetical protein